MLYSFGDQNLFFHAKNSRRWKDRVYHSDCCTHTSKLWVPLHV